MSETALLTPGQLFGPYEILELVGSGPRASVYRAHDAKLRRVVALKLFHPNVNVSPELIDDVRRASGLSHPHIRTVYGVEPIDGRTAIVMEYVDGVSLKEACRDGLPVEQVLRYGRQIADAVGHAHRQGVVHGDLKSSNVLITPDGNPKVLDFGEGPHLLRRGVVDQAYASHELDRTWTDTLPYLPPERLRGEAPDRTSDVWTLGVLLYEMGTGSVPYFGSSTLDVSAQILYGSAPAPPMTWPESFGELFLTCLSKEPGARYRDATALSTALATISLTGAKRSWVLPAVAVASLVILGTSLGGYAWWARSRNAETATAQPPTIVTPATVPSTTLAVLPFEPADATSHDAALELGLSDALIAFVSTVPGVSVRPTSAVARYVDQPTEAATVGNDLHVDKIVTGTIRNVGNQLQASLRLVNVGTGARLWNSTFTVPAGDLLSLRDAMGTAIAQQLLPQKDPRVWATRVPHETDNAQAYRAYLDGRYYSCQQTEAALTSAVKAFEHSTTFDPDFALALAGLADARAQLGMMGTAPVADTVARARASAVHAVAVGEDHPQPHAALALIHWIYDWDWQEAEREFKRALDLNPSDALTHQRYGLFLASRERFEEALAEIRRARDLDPRSLSVQTDMGEIHAWARQYPAAVTELQHVLDTDPGFARAHIVLGLTYLMQRNVSAGVASLERARQLDDGPWTAAALGYGYGVSGNRARAEAVRHDLESMALRRRVPPFAFAMIAIGLGDHDQALTWLKRAYLERSDTMAMIGVYPWLDPLRDDPALADLEQQIVVGRIQ